MLDGGDCTASCTNILTYLHTYLLIAVVTVIQEIDLPDSLSNEMRTLLEGLLQREVCNRMGCRGAG